MSNLTVAVKWNRETFKDIECDTNESPDVFKAQLFALTGVVPDRQKVMVRGKTLGTTWDAFPIANGSTLLMMGSADEVPQKPVEKPKFMEDMNEAEIANALDLPMGLQNLGNTCYMNATVQCLKTVPTLTDALKKFSGSVAAPDSQVSVTAALRDLYVTMDTAGTFGSRPASVDSGALPPLLLLHALHQAFPRFSERDNHGHLAQQDANECWTELVRTLQQKLPTDEATKQPSVVDQYMGGRFAVEMKCDEAEEPLVNNTESFLQLSCFIETDTRYMQSGLISKLTEKITKNSPTLGRDAVYTKTSKIDRLPAYVTVQMVRFFYKENRQGGGLNAKILKDVKFPTTLDVYDLCSKNLQDKLLPMREKFKEWEDELAQKKGAIKDKPSASKGKDGADAKPKNFAPYSFADDLGSNNSGFYELQAVLTHKGRSSSSGHYVAWVKHNADTWLMCDDDKVHAVTTEDVMKLSGGGDWHIAYVLLYGPRMLELAEGKTIEPVLCETAKAEEEPMIAE